MPPRKKLGRELQALKRDTASAQHFATNEDSSWPPAVDAPAKSRRSSRLNPEQRADKTTDQADKAQPRRSIRITQKTQPFPATAPAVHVTAPGKKATRKTSLVSAQPKAPSKAPIIQARPKPNTKPKRISQEHPRARHPVAAEEQSPKAAAKNTAKSGPSRSVPKSRRIALWIQKLPPENLPAPEGPTPGENGATELQGSIDDDMANDGIVTSSATSTSGAVPGDTQSRAATETTVKGKGQDIKKLRNGLCVRNADPNRRTEDTLIRDIRNFLNPNEEIYIPFNDAQDLRNIFQDFINLFDSNDLSQNCYGAIEDVQNKFNEWKPAHKLFTLTNHDFDFDRNHSLDHSEHVLQRTVLTSVLDRWRLNDMFTFDCEGQWKSAKENPLPVPSGQDKYFGSGLKADLVLYYQFEVFAGRSYDSSTAVPARLQKYAFPDGDTTRCFPLVYIEAKKGMHDLTYALYCNMHNASQALWNIYNWMREGKETRTFFDRVRVFSISLNAEKLIARVHRARPLSDQDNMLEFLWDELYVLSDYSRDQACLLIRNILLNYGVARLRGYLIKAYNTIIGCDLPDIRDIEQMWKRPEVKAAVEQKEAAEAEVAAQAAGAREAVADESSPQASPVQARSSKRAAPVKDPSSSKRLRGGVQDQQIPGAGSFGASGLSIVDE